MRIIGHGIDAVDVARIAGMCADHGDRFLTRVFTEGELEYASGSKRRDEHLAARFAAKEATLKALGTGWTGGIAWTDVEVVAGASGAPALRLQGAALARAEALGVRDWALSLTHTGALAFASVIATGQ